MKIFLFFIILLISGGCSKIEVQENPLLFFWNEMDKKYVYFNEKNVKWDSIRNIVSQCNYLDNEVLTRGFNTMIQPLKDRHVAVYNGEKTMTYSFPYYNETLIDLRYYYESKIFVNDMFYLSQLANDIVYFCPKSFDFIFADFSEALKLYNYNNGIIIDVRNNSGGWLIAAVDLASNFIEGQHVVLYQKYKNGNGHDDFTDFTPIKLKGSNYFPDIKTVLITDKGTYSAANIFVSVMKHFANSIIIGNITGGGGAGSVGGILPNGWSYSISQQPLFDANYRSLESGVEPHHWIFFDKEEYIEYSNPASPSFRLHPQIDFAYKLLCNVN